MKTSVTILASLLLLLQISTYAQSTPLDLSGFSIFESVTGSVTETGGVVTFNENMSDGALYFYNDSFLVDAYATTLSFNYDFSLGPIDFGDYLRFNLNHNTKLYVDTIGPGQFVYDLSSFRGQTISLEWTLVWGDDWGAESQAVVSNIELAAVPEPMACTLFGTGLLCLASVSRRKR